MWLYIYTYMTFINNNNYKKENNENKKKNIRNILQYFFNKIELDDIFCVIIIMMMYYACAQIIILVIMKMYYNIWNLHNLISNYHYVILQIVRVLLDLKWYDCEIVWNKSASIFYVLFILKFVSIKRTFNMFLTAYQNKKSYWILIMIFF